MRIKSKELNPGPAGDLKGKAILSAVIYLNKQTTPLPHTLYHQYRTAWLTAMEMKMSPTILLA